MRGREEEVEANSPRWTTVSDSPHDHEREALAFLRRRLPDRDPYRVWTNFEFTAPGGNLYEVDALVISDNGVHLVEIKSHPGKATNQGSTWYFERGRPVENPRALTEQKCKELKSVLDQAAKRAGVRLPKIWVTASTFLSARDLVCEFDDYQKQHVYGREDLDKQTNLPGIWSGLLGRPQLREGRLKPDEVDRATHDIFVTNKAMRRYTWPRYSLLDHVHYDRQLANYYAGTDIEDL